jgi:hypothetical protein
MEDKTNDTTDTRRAAMGELYASLAKFQTGVRTILNNSNAQYGKYADLSEVLSAVNPALNKNGLVMFQTYTHTPEMRQVLVTTLGHSNGAYIKSSAPLVLDGGRGNALHTWGGATTYQRRYAALSILGLSVGLPDDDGQHATPLPNTPRGQSRDTKTSQVRKAKPASRPSTSLDTVLKLIDDCTTEIQLRTVGKAAKQLPEADQDIVREAYRERLDFIRESNDDRANAVLAALADPDTSQPALDFLGTIGVSISGATDVKAMTDDELNQFIQWQAKTK